MTYQEKMEIKEFLKNQNIDLIGFAHVKNDLSQIPKDFSPKNLLKEVQSIIIFAIPIPKGVLYSKKYDKLLFWRYCNITYRHLDSIANSLCLFLEKQGYISIPINSCFPWKVVNYEFWGLSPLVYLAELSGLGILTKCGLLGHPKYGTRILLGGVITSKPLKESGRITQEICPKDCFRCIEICPVNAIDKTGKVNHDLCMRTANSNPLMALIFNNKELRKSIEFEEIINTIGVDDHAAYNCIKCLKACPLNQ
ncbi:MAG: hypothetical protein ACFFAO_04005 [Candidatus Hermodarchaeota archaeon]